MGYDRKVQKQPVKAVIYTNSFMLNGTVHLLPSERLSDLLDAANKAFLPVTDAEIYTVRDHQIVGRTKFLSLNKNEIVIIYSDTDDMD